MADGAEAPTEISEQLAAAKARHAEAEAARIKEVLAIQSMGAMVTDGILLQTRINTFIAFVLNRLGNVTDEVRHLLLEEFETQYELDLTKRLQDIRAEVRKASLGLGAGLTPQQVQQMANLDPGINGGVFRPGG